ncbi:MAG: hypothetical protein E4H14_07885 [Candidatus Thorarchaeota archaeon]|nr:MAG: hypothetical protein E4H14_07885 [Candidatus Thorarchaeota archaeon]
MSLPARISFSQIGIFISILVYLVVRGFFVLLTMGGPFWTQVGGYLSVAFPLGPVIVLGFAACVVSYAFSYLGLWMMDKNFFLLGEITILLSVIIIPGALAVYSWFGFTIA